MAFRQSRRDFLSTSAIAAAATTVPYFVTSRPVVADEAKAQEKNDRPHVGRLPRRER